MSNERLQLYLSFYGVGTSKNYDKKNIDSPIFDPHEAFNDTVQKETLEALRRKSGGLEHGEYFNIYYIYIIEITSIDNKLQSLVYENYSKFIVAGDTIHQMKQHVEDMEDQMQTLTNNIEKINRNSGQVDNHLKGRREKLEQLTSINNLLTKVFNQVNICYILFS
jgi:chromosome segregation ATPase